MKKVFLAFAVLGLVTLNSCKKEDRVKNVTENTAEETAQEAAETAETMENTAATVMNIPQFSNKEVQKFAEEYAAYYREIEVAAKEGKQAKIDELQQQSVEWAQKAKQHTQNMTAEEMQTWNDWTQKIAAAAQGQ